MGSLLDERKDLGVPFVTYSPVPGEHPRRPVLRRREEAAFKSRSPSPQWMRRTRTK